MIFITPVKLFLCISYPRFFREHPHITQKHKDVQTKTRHNKIVNCTRKYKTLQIVAKYLRFSIKRSASKGNMDSNKMKNKLLKKYLLCKIKYKLIGNYKNNKNID